ncbi:phenylacetate--CoA ligase [Pandoraea horticolens]|uniref:Phenylacetate--CoA ligase n=1 Tax=Pandoraea horticolens TaxID=2508298 RepID=A0A5E4ZD86_9BURK|nr:F390 synthetase-related protein [Pandoraea horticolens]VVE58637.1 phenylacetate--CoA ligase [Pandoraea horticolens]
MTNRLANAFAFLHAFVRTRWGLRFRSREALLAYQQRQLRRFSSKVLPKSDFYRRYANQALASMPVVTKRDMLNQFDAFNTAGITLDDARELALRAETERNFRSTLPGGVTIGLSSGTSGDPNVFLASTRERHVWAGIMLARILTGPMLRRVLNPFSPRVRVAFFLRANSNLYETVDGMRVGFRFFDLIASMAVHLSALADFAPDILIAPPSVLHRLADLQRSSSLFLRPAQVISVAEVLEPDDRTAIEQVWDVSVIQIYQCTEGFLGYTCGAGSLHLNEEFLHIEPAWVDHAGGRFESIITDFTRKTQLFVRFRMDDVLQIAPTPCTCGRHSLRLAAIEGRRDDVLWLSAKCGNSLIPIFPDQLRRAMLVVQEQFNDYRIEQRTWGLLIRLHTQGDLPKIGQSVRRELERLWSTLQVQSPALSFDKLEVKDSADKRRRIRGLERSTPCNHSPDSISEISS